MNNTVMVELEDYQIAFEGENEFFKAEIFCSNSEKATKLVKGTSIEQVIDQVVDFLMEWSEYLYEEYGYKKAVKLIKQNLNKSGKFGQIN